MKAMILAAGRGERMKPFTDHTPKPLAPFRGERLIEPLLRSLFESGVRQAVINVCHLGDQIMEFLGDGRRYGLQLQYSIESYVGQWDTGGGILKALPMLGPQPFLVVSADIFSNFNFSELLKKKLLQRAHLVMVENPSFNPQGDFHLQADGFLTERGNNMLTYANIGILDPLLFSNLPLEKIALGKIFRAAVAKGQITGEKYDGTWHNVGAFSDLAALNNSY
ncbi:MAG: nucleotidyltransferase family protein [Proteobacteria bacterium]|nr:nucleotidyltransferase family protein [Pseudomonadota bacterium]